MLTSTDHILEIAGQRSRSGEVGGISEWRASPSDCGLMFNCQRAWSRTTIFLIRDLCSDFQVYQIFVAAVEKHGVLFLRPCRSTAADVSTCRPWCRPYDYVPPSIWWEVWTVISFPLLLWWKVSSPYHAWHYASLCVLQVREPERDNINNSFIGSASTWD